MDKKFLIVSAAMEGEATVIKHIGRKVKISEMEAICLVNLAEIGLLAVFSELGEETGDDADRRLEQHIQAIRDNFGSKKRDGLSKLVQSTAALVHASKLNKYLVAPSNPAGSQQEGKA